MALECPDEQHANTRQTSDANDGVSDPKHDELGRAGFRLKSRQESEQSERSDGQQEQRADNGDKEFHDLVAFFSRVFRHFSLQYFTSSQTLAHFFRHLNGLPQTTQVFSGRLGFLCVIGEQR